MKKKSPFALAPGACLAGVVLLFGAASTTVLMSQDAESADAAESSSEAAAESAEMSDGEKAYNAFLDSLSWQSEGTGDMGEWATLAIPQGFQFIGGDDTRKLMEVWENILTDREQGLIGPEGLDWVVVFEFNDAGYVADDEKDELDAEKIYSEFKANEGPANEHRESMGYEKMYYDGWVQEPKYNEVTNNLEWGVKLRTESGGETVNYETKLLGRHGYMEVTLICSPEILQEVMPAYQDVLTGFEYKSGKKYAEFQDGDKLAAYGLTGLIVGGSALVAAKAGLFAVIGKAFAKFWKFILIGLAAVGAFVKKMFGRGKSEYQS